MQLMLERRGQRPLYQQVVDQIQSRIRAGTLPPGARLPPIRQLATDLGLTRLTVHNAYAELQADGWIESYVGRGTYVAERGIMPLPVRLPNGPPPDARNQMGSLADVLRLAQRADVLSFAQAAPAPETFPVREFKGAIQHVLQRDGTDIWNYGSAQGEQGLLEQLAIYLQDRAVQVTPDEIVVVAGAQQGLDVTLRALLHPGDVVLVEEPTYLGMVERMELQGLRLRTVPVDSEGIQPAALERVVAAHRPKLLYTVPTYHNPTGISMSAARQLAVLDIAQRANMTILEDDIYGPLSYDGVAPLPLKARDAAGIVIYLTSFSKVLMPGIRLGLLAAVPSLLPSLITAKRLADMHSPQLTQRALAEYLARGHMASHLRTTRALYRERRDAMVQSLRHCFPSDTQWSVPSGGLCMWIKLPPNLRSSDLYDEAIDRGVAFAPGQVFYGGDTRDDHLRLSFALHTPADIARGMEILGDLVHEQVVRRRGLRTAATCSVPLV